jgi:hypothetical protein
MNYLNEVLADLTLKNFAQDVLSVVSLFAIPPVVMYIAYGFGY